MEENNATLNAMLNIQNYHRVKMIKDILHNASSYADNILDEIELSRDDDELYPDSNISRMIENISRDLKVLNTYL